MSFVSPLLPIQLSVSVARVGKPYALYSLNLSNTLNSVSWVIDYRFSSFVEFKNDILNQITCSKNQCNGACYAMDNYIRQTFPSRRLPWNSHSFEVTADRRMRLEEFLCYLLRCCLLPGPFMRCLRAKLIIPRILFYFLGIRSDMEEQSRSLLLYYRNYEQFRREMTTSNHQTFKTSNQILVQKGHDTETIEDEDVCAICLEGISITECHASSHIVTLDCTHTYHRGCLVKWIVHQRICPICRRKTTFRAYMKDESRKCNLPVEESSIPML